MSKEELIERIKKIDNLSFYLYKNGNDESNHICIDDIEKVDDIIIDDNLLISHDYSAYGDYGGYGSVGMSNHRILLEISHCDIYGGYGYHCAAIPLLYLVNNPEQADAILDIYQGLNDYPCIDDEDLSKLEHDLSTEAFNDYYKDDLIKVIENKFKINIDDYNLKETMTLWNLLETLSERSSNYWINEYTTMYIDIDRCVDSMTIDDFKEYFSKGDIVNNV